VSTVLVLGTVEIDALWLVSVEGIGRQWDWAEHKTVADLPALERPSNKVPRRPRLTLRLHFELRNLVLAAVLEAMGEARKPIPLALGNGAVVGWYVLDSVDPVWDWTLSDGTPLSGTLTLALRESRPPKGTDSPRYGIAGVSTERTMPQAIDIDRDPSEVTLAEIVRS
jgi:hypothetical protein